MDMVLCIYRAIDEFGSLRTSGELEALGVLAGEQ